LATLHRALELGVNLLDTADLYGPLLNERLVGQVLQGRRQDIILATKFGFEVDDNEQWTGGYNGRPEYVRKSIERSLRNLNTDYIDLYYLHRVDPNTPLEDTGAVQGGEAFGLVGRAVHAHAIDAAGHAHAAQAFGRYVQALAA
nr:hypothetical protein [Tanacetum cinerariifolium]